MKHLLSGLALSLVCLVAWTDAAPQRSRSAGSRPSASRPVQSSRPAPTRQSTPSRAAPRPSSPPRSVRPAPTPTHSPSIRPSSPVRTAPAPVPSRGSTPPRTSGIRSPELPTRSSTAGTAPGPSGLDIYGGRAVTGPSITPSTDSAPGETAVGGVGSPTAGAPGGTPSSGFVPVAGAPSRVRFPTPYTPTRGTTWTGTLPPRDRTATGSGGPVLGSPLGPNGSKSVRSGPAVGYDRGPLKRKEATTNGLVPARPAPTTTPATPSRPSPGGSGTAIGGKNGVRGERLSRVDPGKARRVRDTTAGVSLAHDTLVDVAVAGIGGVRPGAWRGRGSPYHGGYGGYWNDPCGPNSGWWFGWTYSSPFCWSWNWALCWGLYYPCWWWTTRPYYSSWYCYYPAVTTIVYPTETRVVYADSVSYADPAPSGPVGEAAVVAAAPADSPLTIVAQRYLELGDRAFREGRYTDAVQFYAKAVEFAPDQGGLYLVLSDALFAAGDYHYGAYAVRRALELDPGLVETQVDKHGFYPQPEIFDQQLAVLERYVSEHPSDRDARLVLALNYLFAGRSVEAAGILGAPSAVRPGDQAASLVYERARTLSPLPR